MKLKRMRLTQKGGAPWNPWSSCKSQIWPWKAGHGWRQSYFFAEILAPRFGRRLSPGNAVSCSEPVRCVLPPDPGPWHTAWQTGPWRPPWRWTWCRWTAARGSLWPGCSAAAWPRRLPVCFREEEEEECGGGVTKANEKEMVPGRVSRCTQCTSDP